MNTHPNTFLGQKSYWKRNLISINIYIQENFIGMRNTEDMNSLICLSQINFTHRIVITTIEYNNYKKTVKTLNVKYK